MIWNFFSFFHHLTYEKKNVSENKGLPLPKPIYFSLTYFRLASFCESVVYHFSLTSHAVEVGCRFVSAFLLSIQTATLSSSSYLKSKTFQLEEKSVSYLSSSYEGGREKCHESTMTSNSTSKMSSYVQNAAHSRVVPM